MSPTKLEPYHHRTAVLTAMGAALGVVISVALAISCVGILTAFSPLAIVSAVIVLLMSSTAFVYALGGITWPAALLRALLALLVGLPLSYFLVLPFVETIITALHIDLLLPGIAQSGAAQISMFGLSLSCLLAIAVQPMQPMRWLRILGAFAAGVTLVLIVDGLLGVPLRRSWQGSAVQIDIGLAALYLPALWAMVMLLVTRSDHADGAMRLTRR